MTDFLINGSYYPCFYPTRLHSDICKHTSFLSACSSALLPSSLLFSPLHFPLLLAPPPPTPVHHQWLLELVELSKSPPWAVPSAEQRVGSEGALGVTPRSTQPLGFSSWPCKPSGLSLSKARQIHGLLGAAHIGMVWESKMQQRVQRSLHFTEKVTLSQDLSLFDLK